MSTHSTVGTSFGADGLAPRPVTSRQKAEQASKAEQEQLAAMPPQVRAWRDRLDLADLAAFSVVAKHYAAEGMAPVRITTGDLARALKTDERDAADRLERCIRSGAIERTKRIAAAPVFRPCARAADAVTVTTKGEARTFAPAAPGSLMGLRRRD